MKQFLTPFFVLALGLFFSANASAQYSDQYRRPQETPDNFEVELGLGQYRPDVGSDAFERVFGSDYGPALRLELDVLPLRIPYVGRIGVGFQAGWSRHSARACVDRSCQSRVDEDVVMRIWPLSVVAVLRVDVLARELGIPLVFAGKIGLDAVIYDINRGDLDEARSASLGLKWGAQVALQLDFIAPRRARSLDDAWGINHTALFFELFGSTASSKLEIGTNLSWLAGLSLTF